MHGFFDSEISGRGRICLIYKTFNSLNISAKILYFRELPIRFL